MHPNYKIYVLLLLISFSVDIYSWEKEEHQRLADLVFDSTLSFCGLKFNDSIISFPSENGSIVINKMIWNSLSFGDISAWFSGDDILKSRCHRKGYTIMQQLESLHSSYIDKVWNEIKETPENIHSVEVSDQNALFNYLLYHLIALRFAGLPGNEIENKYESLRYALIYEAVAQSYLSDSFSAGHLLLLVDDFLAPLNRLNIQIAHDHYGSDGVYVIDSHGECWQTFGDKLLEWYPASFSHVFEACSLSMRELFLVYYTSLENTEIPARLSQWAKSIDSTIAPDELTNRWISANDGDKYYSEIKVPALLCIPMPVAATWSIQTMKKDQYGIHFRKQYPQLSEEKYHDPDLTNDELKFLYSNNSIPGWMIPEFLPNDTLKELIKYHPDIASVLYMQDRYFPPSYEGALFIVGTSMMIDNGKNKFGTSIGFGWGLTEELLFMVTKPSIIVSIMRLSDDKKNWFLTADFGIGINLPVFDIFRPHIEFGYARGFKSSYNENAGKYAFGFESKTLPLGFTYAGLTFRLKYQFIYFEKILSSPVLEIILH